MAREECATTSGTHYDLSGLPKTPCRNPSGPRRFMFRRKPSSRAYKRDVSVFVCVDDRLTRAAGEKSSFVTGSM